MVLKTKTQGFVFEKRTIFLINKKIFLFLFAQWGIAMEVGNGLKIEFTKQIPVLNEFLAKYSCVRCRKRETGVIEYGCNLFCRQVFI